MKISKLIDLSDRTALITGATGGLGRVFAQTLAELNSNLVLVDKPGSDLVTLRKQIEESYEIEVEIFFADLEKQESRQDLYVWIKESRQALNILVNNAAFVG